MAKLFLESTDTSVKVSNSNTKVYGATGDQAVIIDGALTGVEINSNVERVQFTGATTDYTYKVVGTDLEVYTSAGALVTKVGVQDDTTGTKLTFANGTVDAKITGLNAATVGGQAVSTTAATAVTIPAANVDTTIASAAAPVFSVSAPTTSVTEAANAVASFTVSLNAAQPAATSVSFALGNVGSATTADYGTAALTAVTGGATLAGSVLTFPAGITTATITVPVTVDAITETGEGVSLTLSAPSTGATVSTTAAAAQVLIQDPPTPVFSLSASATSAVEGTPAVGSTAAVAAGSITLTVTRSGNTTGTNSVDISSTAGTALSTDYTLAAATGTTGFVTPKITFAPNETTKTLTFTPVADSTREGDETVTLTLSNASTGASITPASAAVTLTITDDDANQLPVITVPATAPSAFIGDATAITGISFTDGDDNIGFEATVTAQGASQVALSTLTPSSGGIITVKNAAGTALVANQTSNSLTIAGTKADVSEILGKLKYATNSTTPTNEQITISVKDAVGGISTKSLTVNVGESKTLTSSSDSLNGSAGDDEFKGTLTNYASTDTITASTGTDKLLLTAVNTTVAAANVSGVEILDLTLTGASTVAALTATNFGTSLTTVNINANSTASQTLGLDKVNAGTTVNVNQSSGVLTISDVYPTAGTTDAFTVNLTGGITLAGITGSTVVDILNINSTGTSANTITSAGISLTNTNNPTINVGGTQAINLGTLPDLGATGKLIGTNASGKITATAAAADSADFTGGSAGDVLTGDAGSDTINGAAGNDTINGGAGNDSLLGGAGDDSITSGTGADTINGGAGVDKLVGDTSGVKKFVFTTGDSGNTSTTRDTIEGLKEDDQIMIGGYGIAALTNDTALTSTGTIRVDATNKLLVIGTEEINIPANVANASYTYKTNSTADVSDDYILVGSAALTYTNNESGKLTISGKAVNAPTLYVDMTVTPPTAGTSSSFGSNNPVRGSNGLNALDASTLTVAAVNVKQNTTADTIVGSAQADTFNYLAQANLFSTNAVDSIVGGAGTDILNIGDGANTDFTIANTDVWTRISGVETIKTVASSGMVSITLAATAQTAGITTVDLSSATKTTTNVINVSAFTAATTLFGPTVAGNADITGGAAADVIRAGAGGGTIIGGGAADSITAAAGTDIIKWTATTAAAFATETGSTAGTNVTFTAGSVGDKVVSFTTGTDKLHFAVAGLTGGNTDTAQVFATGSPAAVADTTRFLDVTGTTANANTVAGAVTYLNALTTTNVAVGDSLIAALSDGTDTYLYYVKQVSTADTIAAQDVTLIGQVNGALATGDFVSF